MYRHILIPTDGSELAEHAVTNGLSLAKSIGAKVTVIIVVQPIRWLLAEHGAIEELVKHGEQMKKDAASVLNRVTNAAQQAGVSCATIQVEDEQPYRAIIATAADRGCDLIVMASHGRSGLSAVVLGSVTNKVLTHTKIPVLVCRRTEQMYANTLLSTDGSDVARKGVEHGIALAKALNAKVTVITVTEPLPVDVWSGHAGWIPPREMLDSFDRACMERAGEVLDEVRAMAEQIGISVEFLHVPNAHPATAIIETAKSRGCDLIVMGSHGRRGLRKLLLGSQTSEVLVDGSVPVLVVRT